MEVKTRLCLLPRRGIYIGTFRHDQLFLTDICTRKPSETEFVLNTFPQSLPALL